MNAKKLTVAITSLDVTAAAFAVADVFIVSFSFAILLGAVAVYVGAFTPRIAFIFAFAVAFIATSIVAIAAATTLRNFIIAKKPTLFRGGKGRKRCSHG
jgi:hypothetical protein